VRPYVVELVKLLKAVPGIEDISMTTNAILLPRMAQELKDAGLDRVNISLDTFKPERFQQMCGAGKLEDVLAGIEAAKKARLDPVKTNTVVLRGVNDDEVVDFARKSITDGWNVRYIEEMPLVGNDNGCKMVSIEEIKSKIENELGALEPSWPANGHGPAKYYRIPGSSGTIGFIGPVTNCFCETCNRFRLTADGKLRPCLLRDDEVDLRVALRGGASDDDIEQLILKTAAMKYERHQLAEKISPQSRNMRQIGG
jgi:cyclic pyranopterin phosphate synthase